jgi:hypothetical protein
MYVMTSMPPRAGSEHLYMYICIHACMYLSACTADFKVIETFSTVFNDFLVVIWYKNPLKTVGPVPIILKSAVCVCVCVCVYVCVCVCV